MAEVIFKFNGIDSLIQCKIEDKFKDICEKFSIKIQIDINKLIFIYRGEILNLEFTFKEIVNQLDEQNLKMIVSVYNSDSTTINEIKNLRSKNNEIKKDFDKLKYKNEINLIYQTENKCKQQIFGQDFVENNVNKIELIINGIKNKLTDVFELENGKNNITLIIEKNLTKLEYMFYGCKSLYNIDELKYLDVSRCHYFSYMFDGCSQLSDIKPLEKWDVSKSFTFNHMFVNC